MDTTKVAEKRIPVQRITVGFPAVQLILKLEGVRTLQAEDRKPLVNALWNAFVNEVRPVFEDRELLEEVFVPWEEAEVFGADWREAAEAD